MNILELSASILLFSVAFNTPLTMDYASEYLVSLLVPLLLGEVPEHDNQASDFVLIALDFFSILFMLFWPPAVRFLNSVLL